MHFNAIRRWRGYSFRASVFITIVFLHLLLQHSMLFFFHNYELPAILSHQLDPDDDLLADPIAVLTDEVHIPALDNLLEVTDQDNENQQLQVPQQEPLIGTDQGSMGQQLQVPRQGPSIGTDQGSVDQQLQVPQQEPLIGTDQDIMGQQLQVPQQEPLIGTDQDSVGQQLQEPPQESWSEGGYMSFKICLSPKWAQK